MSNYKKGRSFEYRVKYAFEKAGYIVRRSGGSKFPDLWIYTDGGINKLYGIAECKFSKTGRPRIPTEELKRLISTALSYNCLPIYAGNFSHKLVILNMKTYPPEVIKLCTKQKKH